MGKLWPQQAPAGSSRLQPAPASSLKSWPMAEPTGEEGMADLLGTRSTEESKRGGGGTVQVSGRFLLRMAKRETWGRGVALPQSRPGLRGVFSGAVPQAKRAGLARRRPRRDACPPVWAGGTWWLERPEVFEAPSEAAASWHRMSGTSPHGEDKAEAHGLYWS